MATVTMTGTTSGSNVFMSNGTGFHYVNDSNGQQIASLNARVASLEAQLSTVTFQVSQLDVS